jgi:hypothetical protein
MALLPNKLLAQAVEYKISGPGLSPTDNVDATVKIEQIVSNLLGILTLIAVIFFAIQIILAGFGFISSEGDEKKMEANRSKLTNGVLGLFIVIVAVGLGRLISQLLGLNNPFDIQNFFTTLGL